VIGIVPSLSGALLGWLLGQRMRVPVGILFQDLLGPAAAQSGYRGGRTVAAVTRKLEGAVARRADQVAIVADGFRLYLEDLGVPMTRVLRVRNWDHLAQPLETLDQVRARVGWSSSDFVCLHAGNMGQKQGLDNVLDAADLLRDRHVKIVLAGDGNDRDRLFDRARRLRLDNVCFLGLQAAGYYEAMLRAADVLLLNQRPSVVEMSLPGKLTSYFASGRPVVAAVAIESDAAREVEQAQAGIVLRPGDPAALANALLRLRDAPQAAAEFGSKAQAYAAAHLSPPGVFSAYDEFLQRLLDGRD
jgi:glycosyltransferase involved in cell wall biosynthesis